MSAKLERTDLTGWSLEKEGYGLLERLEEAMSALRAGRPLIHPTETVYGVGSNLSEAGVKAVRRAKGRSGQKSVLALIPGIHVVEGLAWTDEARELARIFWPGAVTLVLNDPDETFPAGVRSPAGTVAIRHSSHPIAMALVDALGAPMTSTSANRPGEPPARTSEEALAFSRALAEEDPAGVMPPHFVDAGDLPESLPSTVIDCTETTPRVLREGAVPLNRLRCVLPEIEAPQ